MQKTVVIHQPDFMPYLGFFHRFLHADLYIVLDHVQFVKGSRAWTNRDKIKTNNGEKWLTVSVEKAERNTSVNDIKLSKSVDWKKNNLELIKASYNKAGYYQEIMAFINEIYEQEYTYLYELNLSIIKKLMQIFEVEIPSVLSSKLDPVGAKNELLVDLLKKVDATHYLSGLGARDYFEPDVFADANIEVKWQDFTHPVYPQLHGEFLPYLSSIDLLFNCGLSKSKDILRGVA